jgi:Xaa-Pro aminopeptidase
MFETDTVAPAEEIQRRLSNLQSQLRKNDIDAAIVQQRADLYYFSGTIQDANLYVPVEGRPLLMVHRILARAEAESPIASILPLASPRKIPAILQEEGLPAPRSLGMELDVLPVNLWKIYRNLFAATRILDISSTIRMLRAVKSDYELELIRTAAGFSDRVAARVPEWLREGISELELAGKVEAEARRLGHQGVVRMRKWGSEMFYGHLMAGPSGAVPSFLSSPTGGTGASPAVAQGPGFRPVGRGEPLLVDYVFAHRGYYSDHARIYSIGELPKDLQVAHGVMLKLQAEIKSWARPGVRSGEIYDRALNYAREAGYGDYFMGHGPERIRFVGHGVGLELDEFPFLAAGQQLELTEGMVIALEPKLVIPGKGVVGVENTHVVTPKGLDQLGEYPDEITVV